MKSNQYCTVLDVAKIISKDIFGLTLWECFITHINDNNDIADGAVYFVNLNDAMNIDTGDNLLMETVYDADINQRNNRNNTFNK